MFPATIRHDDRDTTGKGSNRELETASRLALTAHGHPSKHLRGFGSANEDHR